MSIRLLLAILVSVFANVSALAQQAPKFDDSASNLMVVLRETQGENKQDESLVPMRKARVKLDDGKEIDVDTSWFAYIGDMHIRFVFDGEQSMRGATPADLERLKLSPEAALALAVANIKRVYGEPRATPWTAGLMNVEGKSPDLNSSYFLDREYWRSLIKRYPEGVVVSVAKRGGLLYSPLSNSKAVETLRKGVAYLHSSSERMRVSSALFLFKEDKWTVFQAPSAK